MAAPVEPVDPTRDSVSETESTSPPRPKGGLVGRFPALNRLTAWAGGRKRVPYVQQTAASDCGSACLAKGRYRCYCRKNKANGNETKSFHLNLMLLKTCEPGIVLNRSDYLFETIFS